jgi:hypothetical protein
MKKSKEDNPSIYRGKRGEELLDMLSDSEGNISRDVSMILTFGLDLGSQKVISNGPRVAVLESISLQQAGRNLRRMN